MSETYPRITMEQLYELRARFQSVKWLEEDEVRFLADALSIHRYLKCN